MFRALWQIVVAGWISAALTVSPVLAAMQCRVCCDDRSSAPSKAAAIPACCAQHAKTLETESSDPCPACPKCEAQRPNPAVAGPFWDWKPPFAAIAGEWAVLSDSGPALVSALDVGRSFVDRATPPPRVMFCTWQK